MSVPVAVGLGRPLLPASHPVCLHHNVVVETLAAGEDGPKAGIVYVHARTIRPSTATGAPITRYGRYRPNPRVLVNGTYALPGTLQRTAHIAGYALPGRASALCADVSRGWCVLALTGTDGEFLPQGVDLGDFRDVLCAVVECCGESAFDRVLFQDALPVGDPARAGSGRFD